MNRAALDIPEREQVELSPTSAPDALQVIKKILSPLASLRLTVVLFVLAIVLIFCGTVAQKDEGNWTALHAYFRSWIAFIPLQVFVLFGQIFLGISPTVQTTARFPFPGGWIIGGLLLVNLLAAHAVRFKISWKRSGILLIHSGLIVLMLSELVTGLCAVESRMTIAVGESVNFIDVSHEVELAFIDASDPSGDQAITVPGSILRKGGLIQHELLPVDVEVLEYMGNADLFEVRAGADGGADSRLAQDGRLYRVSQSSESNGVDPDQHEDAVTARVAFKKKNTEEVLGTYLVSLWYYPNFFQRRVQFASRNLVLDDKTYSFELRYRRIYTPYTIYLKKFDHDKYMGTDTPKNFSSLVRLLEPARGEDREVLIWMNHPLFYSGETFYQSGFLPGDRGTVLQVVRNPGWLMPYISCSMISGGMLVHFCIHLFGFLRRRLPPPKEQAGRLFSRFFPWYVVAVAGVYLVLAMMPPAEHAGEMRSDEFGKILVTHRGRVKPFDTLARNSLMVISNRQTFRDESGKEQPAIQWLLDVLSSNPLIDNPAAASQKIIRIENDEVLDLLKLDARPGSFRYSMSELKPKFDQLIQAVSQASKIDPKQRNLFQAKVLELGQHLELYRELDQWQEPCSVPPASANGEWVPLSRIEENALQNAINRIRSFASENNLDLKKLSEERLTELAFSVAERERKELNPAAQELVDILRHYKNGNVDRFNEAVGEYRKRLEVLASEDVAKARFEVFFNRFAPFYQCTGLYVVVFLLTCFSWVAFSKPLNRAAFWLALLTLVVHTFALLARMCIQGRPPVTNLYSSAVFIGWGGLVLGLILEAIFRNSIGNLVASVLGFLTSIIAHHLASGGDTLEMMQAVLDTNFWLATHVTCVTLGYTATFVAGKLGTAFILLGVFTPWLNKDLLKSLSQMLYGILCFATLLSFTGTVLGGIWADQSWGRFWGWDPKENGALIIVLWNALILHARWSGMVKQRGMAVLAIVGNMVTGWSWFGTNQLGAGLHNYGFNSTLATGLTIYWTSQLVLIGIGLIPLKHWRSFASQQGSELKPKSRKLHEEPMEVTPI